MKLAWIQLFVIQPLETALCQRCLHNNRIEVLAYTYKVYAFIVCDSLSGQAEINVSDFHFSTRF